MFMADSHLVINVKLADIADAGNARLTTFMSGIYFLNASLF